MIGKRFSRLVVVEETELRNKSRSIIYKCKCDCGSIKNIAGASLRRGLTTSCGCYCKEISSKIVKNIKKEDHQRGTANFIKNQCKEGTTLSSITDKRKNINNTSTVKGVYWDKSKNKWRAQIVFKGICYNLGRFNSLEEAKEARKKGEEKYHKPFLKKHNKL